MTYQRFACEDDVSLSTTEEGAMPTITGIAVPYGVPSSQTAKGFSYVFSKSAFDDYFDEGRVDAFAYLEHNRNAGHYASTQAGTIRTKNTSKGLSVEIQPIDTPYTRHVAAMVAGGEYRKFSIGAYIEEAEWKKGKETLLYVINKARFDDISLVAQPRFDQTSAGIKTFSAFDTGDIDPAEYLKRQKDNIHKLNRVILNIVTLGAQ